MQKRISHRKSRRGCQACKRRHIKCDEQGPPCANCVARHTHCDYVLPENAGVRTTSVPSPSTAESSSSGSEHRSILELELMHRWSTHTFRTMCGIPEEEHYLSKVMPREALKHDFMLDGIFAVTALDIARSSEEPDATKYENIALEYYNRGSAAFRELLSDIPPDIYHLMFIFASSAAVMVLGLRIGTSSSGDEQTALDRVMTLADLFHGTLLIIHAGWDKLVENYIPFRAALSTKVNSPDILDRNRPVNRDDLPFRFASLDILDDDIKVALSRLDEVNDAVHKPPSTEGKPEEGEDAAMREQEQEQEQEQKARAEAHEMYRVTIFWLKEIFAEQKMDIVKGYCLSFFLLVGKEFAAAAKSAQPLALFILMHWAVQLDKLGEEAWWARTVGKQLVLEISGMLRASPLGSVPGVVDGVAWARQQVNLPA